MAQEKETLYAAFCALAIPSRVRNVLLRTPWDCGVRTLDAVREAINSGELTAKGFRGRKLTGWGVKGFCLLCEKIGASPPKKLPVIPRISLHPEDCFPPLPWVVQEHKEGTKKPVFYVRIVSVTGADVAEWTTIKREEIPMFRQRALFFIQSAEKKPW